MPAITKPTIESLQPVGELIRPARLSLWQWFIATVSRRVAKSRAARLAKIGRALRPGRIGR